ncbi:MAG: dephospho-CoA kinase [Verrucomicrobiota bacterium]
MVSIAITGGVACGKSFACDLLLERFPTGRALKLDCDDLVRELLSSPEVTSRLKELDQEGEQLFDGDRLNKSILRKRVFENSGFRAKVESVLHPLVLDRVDQVQEDSKTLFELMLIEVPLLYEVEFPIKRDLELVVAASGTTQMRRLTHQRNVEPEVAGRIIDSQLPINVKIERGDIVIWNDSQKSILEKQVDHLARRCLPLFR